MSNDTAVLAIIGCGDAKVDESAKARNLYSSNYFGLKEEYGDHFADDIAILSAEHGIVDGDEVLEPYDTHISDRDSSELIREVADDLRAPETDHTEYDEVILLLSKDYYRLYRDAVAFDRSRGPTPSICETTSFTNVLGDADLGGIGEQMGWLRQAVDDDERFPDYK